MASKKTPTAVELAAAFRLIADYFENLGAGATIAEAATSAGDDVATENLTRAEVNALGIKELRELAVSLDLDEQKVKAGILAELDESGYFGDDEDEDDDSDDVEEDDEEDGDDIEDEDDEDEEEGDDEEEGFSREELEEMDLKQLKALAKQEGHSLADYRGLDQEGLIELILGEGDDEDEDSDEDDEEDTEEIDEEALRAMSLIELKKLAAELDIKVPANIAKKKDAIVDLILEAAGEEDEDDE